MAYVYYNFPSRPPFPYFFFIFCFLLGVIAVVDKRNPNIVQNQPTNSNIPVIQDLNQHVKRPSVIMPVPVISDKQNDKRKLADAIIRKWNKKLNFRLWDFSPPPPFMWSNHQKKF